MALHTRTKAQNPFTLAFEDKNLEKRYKKYYDAQVKRPLRYGIIISILSWYSGLSLIYAVIPEKFSWLSLLTIVYIGSYFGFIVFATFRKRFRGYYHLMGAISNAWAGLYAIYFCDQFPNGANLALPVIIFILFFGSYMVRLRWIAGFIAALSYTLTYTIYIAFFTDLTGPEVAFYAFVAWMVLIFSLLAGRLAESNNRLAYYQAKTIREQSAIIKSEKAFLLKEVHHRVKNNLQIIVSLINLQLANSTDEKSIAALKAAQNRVASMSLVHQRMNRASNFTKISVLDYTQELVNNLADPERDRHETVNVTIPTNVIIDIHTAIPLGLIVNEVTSYFYATTRSSESGDQQLDLLVKESSNRNYIMTCTDRANTFNQEFEASFVFELIEILAEQLDGHITCSGENELVYEIHFSID